MITTIIRYLFLVFVLTLLSLNLSAQAHEDVEKPLLNRANPEETRIPSNQLSKYIDREVYVFDNIWGSKTINDTTRHLYLGGVYPNHLFTVIIRGEKVIKQLSHLQNGRSSHFSGKVFMYEGKPAIIVTRDLQTSSRIRL